MIPVSNDISDDKLLDDYRIARARAHDAPKSSIDNPSDAWARMSRELFRIADEIEQRGLQVPK